ncbi:hypothetical protein MPSEU_000376300 [Mayamaea pseudoterrestris]|nr:hypothetical protein MPSEU_000376300 [Mayamaea pseudoterrestris]
MVKKKGKSNRTTLKDKYKIQRRVTETQRKRKKQGKKDKIDGVVRNSHVSKKDPGIPNSWPFKQELLNDIKKAKEKQQQSQQEQKDRRKSDLRSLREHQEAGGSARTVQELIDQATVDQANFQVKTVDKEISDGSVSAGQQSRRAYLRELKKVVDTADVLLQVLDARDPIASRIHPSIESAIMSRSDKRMVLVLNKIDLVPKEAVGSWLTALRRSHPTIAIKGNSLERRSDGVAVGVADDSASVATSTASSSVGADGLLQLLKNYARTGGGGGKGKTTIVVGVIGYPNVGKSSIINALKHTRAVGVSPRPGFTTTMQEVILDRNVRLLDSPGVVFDDDSALLGNCVDAESIEDPLPAVEALLQRCNHQSLLMTYNIPAFPPGDVMMFLAMVARTKGRVLKGGVPDKVSVARTVLRDWNSGKIPYYTVPPHTAQPEVVNDAKIVSSFGKEFDLTKFDDAVLNNLKDTDEMDFVKLDGVAEGPDVSLKALAFLRSDDQDTLMDEGDETNDGNLGMKRTHLAQVDDYDFDEL